MSSVACTFKIMHQNIRSLRQNLDVFLTELSAINLYPEIIVLSEIWVKSNELDLYNVPNYVSFHKTNETFRAGGISIYIKKNCDLSIIDCNKVYINTADILTLEFKFKNKIFFIIAIYRHHLFDKNLFIREINEFFYSNNCFRNQENVFLIGDINIDILLNDDLIVDNYISTLNINGLECLLKEPTRITSTTSTCIDHVFARVANKAKVAVEVQLRNVSITDHLMTMVTVCMHQPVVVGVAESFGTDNTESYRINYETLNTLLVDMDWSDVYKESNPSIAFDVFINNLKKLISQSIVNKPSKVKKIKKLKPWMTDFIYMKISIKNKIFSKVKKHPQNVKLKSYFVKYRNKLHNDIRILRDSYYCNLFESCKGNSKKTWNVIKDVTGQKTKNNSDIKLRIRDEIVSDKKIIADEFNAFFLSVVENLNIVNDIPMNFDNMEYKQYFPQQFNVKSMFLDAVSVEDLREVINSLKNSTAPGIDGINTVLVKHIHPHITPVLLHLINISFERGIFPEKLKTAVVVPLHKGNSNQDCNNYRPISLLSVFAKIYEKVMKKKLVFFLEKNNFFSNNQFGFRKGINTEVALDKFIEQVYLGLNSEKRITGLFLDIKKAFDTVDHNTLLQKLFNCGIRGIVHKWFQSYLTARKQCTRVGSTSSDLGEIRHGVPQGSVLGSILFLIYINDLCDGRFKGQVTSFADDTALCYVGNDWETNRAHMSFDLELLQWWFTKNHMLLSPEKTKYINFSLRSEKIFTLNIVYKCVDCLFLHTVCNSGCSVVSQTDKVKYLGILVEQDLSWKSHTVALKTKLNSILRYFYFLNKICNERILKMLYTSLVHSRLEYGLFCWGGCYNTTIKPLCIQQNCFIRLIMKKCKRETAFPLFKSLGILPLKHLFIFKVLRLFFKKSGNLPQNNSSYAYKLRRIDLYNVPKPNFTFFQKSYVYMGPKLFNNLEIEIQNCKSYTIYSKLLKKMLMSNHCIDFMVSVDS